LKLQFRKRSIAELVSCNETETSKAKRIEVFKSNYPIVKGYWEQSRFAESLIPRSLLRNMFPKLDWGSYP
jgi:hypothetical protein